MTCRLCRKPITDGEDYETQLAGSPSGPSAVTNRVHTACLRASLARTSRVREGDEVASNAP